MQLNAHVNFNGTCEEAFKFYEKHLGGKIEVLMKQKSGKLKAEPLELGQSK